MSNLTDRLKLLTESERKLALAQIWRDLKGTEAYEALALLLEDFEAPAMTRLLDPNTAPESRHFFAGYVHLSQTLRGSLDLLVSPQPQAPQQDTDWGPTAQISLHEEEPSY